MLSIVDTVMHEASEATLWMTQLLNQWNNKLT